MSSGKSKNGSGPLYISNIKKEHQTAIHQQNQKQYQKKSIGLL
jgi:hypothetical protein